MGNGSVTCWAVRSATSGAGTPRAEKPVPDAVAAAELAEGEVIGGMSGSLGSAGRWVLALRPDELP